MSDNIFFGSGTNGGRMDIGNMYAGWLDEARRMNHEMDKYLQGRRQHQRPRPHIYTVSRDVASRRLHRHRDAYFGDADNENENAAVLKQDYGGTFYSNRFRCNRRIILQSIGFHGPAESKLAKYNVCIEIYAGPERDNSQLVFDWNWKGVTGKRGEIFHVVFEKPVLIQPGKCYLIQFMLEGEPTKRCVSTLTHVSVPLQDAAGNASVEFSFNVGSKQMPELKFSV